MENILDRIAAETDLTKSERKVAATILKNPALVVNENIAQLAKRAQVSEPSICRFCKRFGAEGFPAFKLILSATVSAENLKKVEAVKQGDTVGDVISKVIGATKNSVSSAERATDEGTIARAIDVVSQSRRIVVLSQGLTSFIGVDFVNRMLNLGFFCQAYTDRQSMMLAVSSLRSGDVVLAISATGKNKDVLEASLEARATGSCVLAICPEETPISECATVHLKSAESVSPEDDSIFANRLSLMLCSQIIIGGVVLRRGIAISDLKPKLKETRLKSYVGVEKEEPESSDPKDDNDDGSLKPGAPITTLDWHPY